MIKQIAVAAILTAAVVGVGSAQTKRPAGPKTVTNDITVTTPESVYTGKMELAVHQSKVTGNMHLIAPTEITGTVAGTSKAGVMSLDFPYHMLQRNCTGTVRMKITVPAKTGPAKGTMEAVGCGRDETRKLTGTVELTPAGLKKPQ